MIYYGREDMYVRAHLNFELTGVSVDDRAFSTACGSRLEEEVIATYTQTVVH